MPSIPGLILSGGRSSRMGRPKALLTYQGRTFLDHLTHVLLAGGCASVTAVVGADADAIIAAAPQCDVVRAERWALGMRASLAAGLAALPSGPVLLTHVDRPRLSALTVERLLTQASDRTLVASHLGQPGHPIVLPQRLRQRLLRVDDTPLRALLGPVLHVETQDPAVLENINTPRDYAQLSP